MPRHKVDINDTAIFLTLTVQEEMKDSGNKYEWWHSRCLYPNPRPCSGNFCYYSVLFKINDNAVVSACSTKSEDDEWKHLRESVRGWCPLKYHIFLWCKTIKQTGKQTWRKIMDPSIKRLGTLRFIKEHLIKHWALDFIIDSPFTCTGTLPELPTAPLVTAN